MRDIYLVTYPGDTDPEGYIEVHLYRLRSSKRKKEYGEQRISGDLRREGRI
jgi:hypothetical protein